MAKVKRNIGTQESPVWETINIEANAGAGIKSIQEGLNTVASGNYSHVEGDGSIASGESAHAEGRNYKAYGKHSHTEGLETIAGVRTHCCLVFTLYG